MSKRHGLLKLKIKKFIKMKVPKDAIFDLNVRHGKLNIPSSTKKMSVILSYGNFIAGNIDGEDNNLKLSNSSVVIDKLQAGIITLKNVPKALLGSITSSKLFANSSDVLIEEVGVDIALSQKFGKLEVQSLVPNFRGLNVVLDYCKADLNFSQADYNYQINSKETSLDLTSQLSEVSSNSVDGVKNIQGYFKSKSSPNKLFLTGVYSAIKLNWYNYSPSYFQPQNQPIYKFFHLGFVSIFTAQIQEIINGIIQNKSA
mgnify:CR=1 FL=1